MLFFIICSYVGIDFSLFSCVYVRNMNNLDYESLAQRISALEKQVEQLNGRMRELEAELENAQPDLLITPTPSYPQLVENCCATSVFVHGKLEYENPHVSACPLHQDVSPHTHDWHCVVSGKTNK